MISETQPAGGNGHAAHSAGGDLRLDVIAGLTAAAVVLPKAMAYATVAGLSASVGLYTTLVPVIVYALLGSSRVLSVSTTTTLAILVGTELGVAVPDADTGRLVAATATLTVMTGVLLIAGSVLRFGFVANFISFPILTGFKAGIGLVIVLDQVEKMFGVHLEKTGYFRDLAAFVRHLPETSLLTLTIGGATLVALLVLERSRQHSSAPLLAVSAGIALSWLFGLHDRGVATIGHIPQALPSLTLPDLALFERLLPGALGIALMSFTETIAAGRAFAARADLPINANRELLATGAANLAGGFFGAMPGGGGTSQTAVVRAAGGHTQKASLVTAAASAATMLAFAPLLGLLPQTVLAAIVIVYSFGLIDPAEFAAIRKVRRMEFYWALVASLGVLVFGTLQGIVVAIVLSMVSLASQAARPKVHVIGRKPGTELLRPVSVEHPNDKTVDGLLMLRPEGRLFFANAQQIADQFQVLVAEYKPRVVLIDMSRILDIEYSALQMMIEGHRRMTEQGVAVWLAELNPDVLEYVRKSDFGDRLGPGCLFSSSSAAIRRFVEEREPVPRGG